MTTKPITFEQVEERLKNVPLEQYTKQDIFDRYVAYGTEEDLNTPNIQMALLKNGYIDTLFEMVDFITDKQVIEDILHKYLPKIKNSIVIIRQS